MHFYDFFGLAGALATRARSNNILALKTGDNLFSFFIFLKERPRAGFLASAVLGYADSAVYHGLLTNRSYSIPPDALLSLPTMFIFTPAWDTQERFACRQS